MTSELDVFDRAVRCKEDGRDVEFTSELIVLGLLHYYKNDRALNQQRQTGVPPSIADVQAFADTYTDQQHRDFREMADQTLSRYVERHMIDNAFWPSVRANIAASFLYSLLLLLILTIIHFFGVDVLSVLRTMTS